MNKITMIFTVLMGVILFSLGAYAMDLSVLTPYLIDWAGKNPKIASVLIFMGGARVYMKPLQIFIRRLILLTPTKWDDSLLMRMEQKAWFKVVIYVLDWLMSVKIESKKKAEKQAAN